MDDIWIMGDCVDGTMDGFVIMWVGGSMVG